MAAILNLMNFSVIASVENFYPSLILIIATIDVKTVEKSYGQWNSYRTYASYRTIMGILVHKYTAGICLQYTKTVNTKSFMSKLILIPPYPKYG